MNRSLGTSGISALRKGGAILERMVARKTVWLRRLGGDRKGEERVGRFFANAPVLCQRQGDGGADRRFLERADGPGLRGAACSADRGPERGEIPDHGAAPPRPGAGQEGQRLRRAGACDDRGGRRERVMPRPGRRGGVEPRRGKPGPACRAAPGGAGIGPWVDTAEQARAMADRPLVGGGRLFAVAAGFPPAGQRTITSQGLRLEDSQMATAERLVKLAACATKAACIDLQLTQGRDGAAAMPATNVLTAPEIDTLAALNPTLEGSTERRQNRRDPSPSAAAWSSSTLSIAAGRPRRNRNKT